MLFSKSDQTIATFIPFPRFPVTITRHYHTHLMTETKRLAFKILILRLRFFYGNPSNMIKENIVDVILLCGSHFEFSMSSYLVRDMDIQNITGSGQSSEFRNSWEHPGALPSTSSWTCLSSRTIKWLHILSTEIAAYKQNVDVDLYSST